MEACVQQQCFTVGWDVMINSASDLCILLRLYYFYVQCLTELLQF